jgi:predicted transcriptional regulator
MQRVQIQLGEEVAARLQAIARSEHRSVAAVVREALGDWLGRQGGSPDGTHDGRAGDNGSAHLSADDLVSVSDIARRCGRPLTTIQTWRRRYASFPQPVAFLATRPVWEWPAVEGWTRRHAAGETRRRRMRRLDPWPSDLPGAELISTGLADIAAGRRSIEAALVSTATSRLRDLGVDMPGAVVARPSDRLYELVEVQVGEARAHSRYNALRRRLSSFLRAMAVANAQAR